MPTLFEKAARWHKGKMDLTACIEVTVRDGNDKIEGVLANPGTTNFEAFDVDQFVGSAKVFDWKVSAEDLIFSGEKREPKTGWEVWQKLADGRTRVYQAIDNDEGRCFDVMDHLGVLLRIHTSLNRIEPA